MKEKIKIVRKEAFVDGCWHVWYDVYVGFVGIPSTWPFMTKWLLDKEGLTELQLKHYMLPYLTSTGKVEITVKAEKELREE